MNSLIDPMCSNDRATTTCSIVTDYFNWRLKKETTSNDRIYLVIRRIASDCEATYRSQQPTFNICFSSSSLIDLKNFHYEVAKELFNGGIITWTRIITFISFSALLAEYLIQQQQQNSEIIVSSIIDWTTNFIDRDLHSWLKSQNYWAGCLSIYEKTPQRRNSISRYASILGTLGMLTIGALYMKRT